MFGSDLLWLGALNLIYGASDVGTNSCRLLIAEINGTDFKTLEKKVVTTRIGGGLEKTGWLRPEAMDRTLECLALFNDVMDRWQVVDRIIVGTSAVREAANREDFRVLAYERLGMDIVVLDGEDEGYLSYLGARRGLKLRRNPIVVDVGGGSSELACRSRKTRMISIPIGAVKATEADLDQKAIKDILTKGNILEFQDFSGAPMVIVGGTATSMVAMKRGLTQYASELVHGQSLSLQDIEELYKRLSSMPVEERRLTPGLQPERADIIVKGILIIRSIMELLKRDQAIISDSDLLDGLIWNMHEKMTIE
ncbi:MAG: Ppx/GppA family phosphatase [Candidatus Saccharibacteria bacterium]